MNIQKIGYFSWNTEGVLLPHEGHVAVLKFCLTVFKK